MAGGAWDIVSLSVKPCWMLLALAELLHIYLFFEWGWIFFVSERGAEVNHSIACTNCSRFLFSFPLSEQMESFILGWVVWWTENSFGGGLMRVIISKASRYVDTFCARVTITSQCWLGAKRRKNWRQTHLTTEENVVLLWATISLSNRKIHLQTFWIQGRLFHWTNT